MGKIAVKDNQVQMSVEFFTDLLKQIGIEYIVRKNSIEFKTPQETYDEGIPVPLELDDSDMLHLAMMAHERNMTFNAFCNKILREKIEKIEQEKLVKKNKRKGV